MRSILRGDDQWRTPSTVALQTLLTLRGADDARRPSRYAHAQADQNSVGQIDLPQLGEPAADEESSSQQYRAAGDHATRAQPVKDLAP